MTIATRARSVVSTSSESPLGDNTIPSGLQALQAKTAAEILPLVNQLTGQMVTPGVPAPTLMADPTGKKLFVDILDHVPEHSIQLHLPWIQHLFGNVPIVAALVPDPVVGLMADDGERMGVDEFVEVVESWMATFATDEEVIAAADEHGIAMVFTGQRTFRH